MYLTFCIIENDLLIFSKISKNSSGCLKNLSSLLYNVLSLYEYFIRLHKLFKYKCCLDFKFHAVKRLKSDAREKKISLGISLHMYLVLVQYHG